MRLDVFEKFSNGKWLGLFHDDRRYPPVEGEELFLRTVGVVRVKSCTQQRHQGNQVDSYTVIVERL